MGGEIRGDADYLRAIAGGGRAGPAGVGGRWPWHAFRGSIGMWSVDVAIIGGGPAGSTCARQLVAAGFDVLVVDAARFPRDKVCAGWITPDVTELLELDLIAYAATNVLQPFTAFRLGLMGGPATTVQYGRVVSYGVRRLEFDDYLLRRAKARVVEGVRVGQLVRDDDRWIVEGEWSARYLVGAGGHRCPVAEMLNPGRSGEPLVVAQRVELATSVPGLAPDTPELSFAPDLLGYGWLVPKGAWVNIGLGRADPHQLPAHVREFRHALRSAGRLTQEAAADWAGHAYLLASQSTRRLVGSNVLLTGDAAGLAAPGSGEGIRSAVLSGLWAADAIRRADREQDETALGAYAAALSRRLGHGRPVRPTADWLPASWRGRAVERAFRSRPLLRRVLNRTFLHELPELRGEDWTRLPREGP